MPELAEKRAVTGTSCLKCNALLTLAASALGTNLPSRTTPLAWAARCVVCLPNAELSASTNDSGVVAIGLLPCQREISKQPSVSAFLSLNYASATGQAFDCEGQRTGGYPLLVASDDRRSALDGEPSHAPDHGRKTPGPE